MTPEEETLEHEYLVSLSKELQYAEKKEEAETNFIKAMLYPSLAAFALLAIYGFYLIQSLMVDVGSMSRTVSLMSVSVVSNMDKISATTTEISQDMDKMVGNINAMSHSVKGMSGNVSAMTDSVSAMQLPMNDMSASTNTMQRDMWSLNQNISTPLGMFNQFMPWDNNSNGPFPGSMMPLPPFMAPQN